MALCLGFHHNVVNAGGMAEVLRIWASVLCGDTAPIIECINDRVGRLSAALTAHKPANNRLRVRRHDLHILHTVLSNLTRFLSVRHRYLCN